MDELAILIAEAPGGSWNNFRPDQQEMFRMSAAAVRTFLASDEAVERAAQMIGDMLETHNPASKSESDAIARAALTAAVGEGK